MKKYLILLTICCLIGVAAQSQNSEVNNTINTSHNGQDPCARPQIITNPFAPQNMEWFTQRNRFNWMDYVTFHNNFKAHSS